jgi:hypothetical protein
MLVTLEVSCLDFWTPRKSLLVVMISHVLWMEEEIQINLVLLAR